MPGRTRIGRAPARRQHVDAIHQPHRRRAVVVLPQDVGLAVTVEVGRGLRRARSAPGWRAPAPVDSTFDAIHQPHGRRAVVVLPEDVGLAVAVEVARLPIAFQLGPGLVSARSRRQHVHAVHQPDRRRAVGVLPQDVGLAVAVEVGGADLLPWRRFCRPGLRGSRSGVRIGKRRSGRQARRCRSAARPPGVPSMFCHRMSPLPSALKSLVMLGRSTTCTVACATLLSAFVLSVAVTAMSRSATSGTVLPFLNRTWPSAVW